MWLRVMCINALPSALSHPAPWAAATATSRGHFSLFSGAPRSKRNITVPWGKGLPLPLDFHSAAQQLTGLSSSALLRIVLQASTEPRSSFHIYFWGLWPVSEENRLTSCPVAVLPGQGSWGAVLGTGGQVWPLGQGCIRFVEKNVKPATTQGLLTGCVVFGYTSQPVLCLLRWTYVETKLGSSSQISYSLLGFDLKNNVQSTLWSAPVFFYSPFPWSVCSELRD